MPAHGFYQDTLPADKPGRCDYTYGDGSICNLRPDQHPQVEELNELCQKLLNRLDEGESRFRGEDFAWAIRQIRSSWTERNVLRARVERLEDSAGMVVAAFGEPDVARARDTTECRSAVRQLRAVLYGQAEA